MHQGQTLSAHACRSLNRTLLLSPDIIPLANVTCAETWAFLEPFSWQLWLALAMTAFGVALVMVIAGKLSPLGTFDMRAMRRLDVPSSPPKEYVVSNSKLSAHCFLHVSDSVPCFILGAGLMSVWCGSHRHSCEIAINWCCKELLHSALLLHVLSTRLPIRGFVLL